MHLQSANSDLILGVITGVVELDTASNKELGEPPTEEDEKFPVGELTILLPPVEPPLPPCLKLLGALFPPEEWEWLLWAWMLLLLLLLLLLLALLPPVDDWLGEEPVAVVEPICGRRGSLCRVSCTVGLAYSKGGKGLSSAKLSLL